MSIISSIRNLIEDNSKFNASSPDTFEYISSKVFTLSEQNVNESSIICYYSTGGTTTILDPSNYDFSSDTGKVTVTASLTVGDILEFHYTYCSKYSEAEILGYISSSLIYLSLEKYGDFILGSGDVITPTLTVPEENLVALVASILIKKSIKSYKTNEVTIIFAEDMSVEKKIKLAIRQFRKATGDFRYIDPNLTTEDVD
ncbi:MAG: hypothetical protein V1901_03770 [Patescibacteria group bacterium]